MVNLRETSLDVGAADFSKKLAWAWTNLGSRDSIATRRCGGSKNVSLSKSGLCGAEAIRNTPSVPNAESKR